MPNWKAKLIVCLFAVIFVLPTVVAAPTAVPSWTAANHEQGIFGGISLNVSHNATSVEITMGELPSIAEVYTATWCENCVPAEEGLMAAIDESGVDTTVLTFHRAIAEVEDPFGVEDADYRWEDRYGDASAAVVGIKRAPPTMIINGEWLHAGSGGLEGEGLKPYYAESLAKEPMFSAQEGTSFLSWESNDGANGTIEWALNASTWLPSSTTSILYVVEGAATFEEGSNHLGVYHDVVRAMVELDGNSGSMQYTLPAAWGGADLSLVLVHQWDVQSEVMVEPSPDDGFLGLPAAGMLLIVVSIVGGALAANPQRKE